MQNMQLLHRCRGLKGAPQILGILSRQHSTLHPAIPPKPTWSPRSHLQPTTDSSAPSLTEAEVQHLAKLAGLSIPISQIDRYVRDINDLCKMVEPIRLVDTADVEPLLSLVREYNARELALRPDVQGGAEVGLVSGRALLKSARKVDGPYYVVEK
ncbi:hypothetical protein PhCBS80983_g06117 [Powellomyces hirtus]|uniref:Uncharacterized protein n=1 Tax=Powellomyces hirtus TaxID=109895 RepID=A0A507DSM5_9FUNG|nr:hypothetical protein PhCBS80983_g06117 [Powellomyces hirtus]